MENGTRRLSGAMSKKISHLMFIMSVLVVYIHFVDFRYAALPGYRWEYYIEYVFASCFGRVSVPLFFCFSGYLTFSKIHVNAKSLVLAYKTKVKTLLVPYLLWNIFYTLVFVCAKTMNHTLHEVDDWEKLLLAFVPLVMTPVTRLAVYLVGPIVIVAAISTVSGIIKMLCQDSMR